MTTVAAAHDYSDDNGDDAQIYLVSFTLRSVHYSSRIAHIATIFVETLLYTYYNMYAIYI